MKSLASYLSLLFALFALNLTAQVPQNLNYQGIVRNASQDPYPNQVVGLRFTIINSSAVEVYSETQSMTTNSFGLLNTTVGEVNQLSFDAIDWSADSYIMKVELDLGNNGSWEIEETKALSSVPYALYGRDEDADPTNELQTITLSGRQLSVSGANSVNLPNDIQNLGLSGRTLSISSSNNVSLPNDLQSLGLSSNILSISSGNSVSLGGYVSPWLRNSSNLYYNAGNVGIGTSNPGGMLHVQGDAAWADETPLFEVKNSDGVPVFAVYNNGVRILVDDDPTAKGRARGGFSVGGFDRDTKGFTETYDFMRVSPDSIRFNINNTTTAKGRRGGFAVGGFDRDTKDAINEDFMHLTPKNADEGLYNTFIGFKAGESNLSSGNYNSFIGYEAGLSNTYGDYNSFMGYQAGLGNTTGRNNSFIGYQAGHANTTGNYNSFMGYQAGLGNTTGTYNVYIGEGAGKLNNGNYNTFIGKGSAFSATGVSWSTSVGFGSGASLQSNFNTMLGAWAGALTTTGKENLFLGTYSGFSNVVGEGNVIVGNSAGETVTGSRNVLIGNRAGQNEGAISNKLYINNSSTSNPLIWGDFFDDLLRFNGQTTIISGVLDTYGLIVHNDNSSYRAHGLRIMCGSDSPSSSTTYALSVADGNGTWAGSITLRNGSLQFNTTSDRRLKTNIRPTSMNALSMINMIPVVDYAYKANPEKELIGFIAQDVEKVLPDAVSLNENGDLQLSQQDLIPVLTKAIQEQQLTIESLSSEVEELKQMLSLILQEQK